MGASAVIQRLSEEQEKLVRLQSIPLMTWYETTIVGEYCAFDMHCVHCQPDGWCDVCDTIDGRWWGAVCEYASTCDECHELTHNDLFSFVDRETQLGMCDICFKKLSKKQQKKLLKRAM